MEVTVKLHEDLGDLELGKLSQKYITDPDIRSLLADTALDAKKMEPYEEDQLRLITSVIYSERFELTGGKNPEVFILERHGIDVLSSLLNLRLSDKRNDKKVENNTTKGNDLINV